MSKELQDKADHMMTELKKSLIPIQKEIAAFRDSSREKDYRIVK